MSIETDIRAALLTDTALTALIGQKLALNAMDQDAAPPYIVFSCRIDRELGMDNTVLGQDATLEFQCWGRSAEQADAVSAALIDALRSKTEAEPLSRSTGYDADMGFDAAIVSAQLLIG
jgi:hypothetical protein